MAVHKRLTTILLLLVIFTACNRGKSPVAPRGGLNVGEYEVLSAYIAGTFTDEEGKRRQVGKDIVKIVIVDSTKSGDDDLLGDERGHRIPWEKTAETLRKKAPTLQQTTIDAFRKANAQQASLRRFFHPAIDYELVDSNQLESIFKNGDGWSVYYRRFPGSPGITTFSRVGFSADGTQALLYMSNRSGVLGGGGRYVVMERRNGRWVTGKEIEMWVS